MEASYRFVVAGTVQGVGFRVATRHKALALGLRGWVRNQRDGRVEGLVTGPDPDLATFRRWLNHGPPTARVTELEWMQGQPEPGEGFHIHR